MSILVKTYAVSTKKRPFEARPLCILMIGDLHGECHGRRNKEILDAAVHMQPDLILTCGDMMHCVSDFDITDLVEFYKALTEIAPVYAVNGNHETKMRLFTVTYGVIYSEYASELRNAGVHVINNRSEEIVIDGTRFRISGFEAPLDVYRRFRRPRLSFTDLHDAVGDAEKDAFTVLLAHNPYFAKLYFRWGADLIVSGHYHGGLVRIGNQPLVSPYGFPFPRYGYGFYRKGTSSMIVTAGAGDHSYPFRVANPKEIVQIILDPGEG